MSPSLLCDAGAVVSGSSDPAGSAWLTCSADDLSGFWSLRESRNSRSPLVSVRASPVTGRAQAQLVLPAPEISLGLRPRAKPGLCTNTVEQTVLQAGQSFGETLGGNSLNHARSQKTGDGEEMLGLCISAGPFPAMSVWT